MELRLTPAGEEYTPAVALVHLGKTYRTDWGRRVRALRKVTMEVPRGDIFGLLGPNGAGKSTTLKILVGLISPSRGRGEVLGEPLGSVQARRRLGFLPENPYFYDYLTATELLDACASLTGMPALGRQETIRALLERVGLDPGDKRRLRKFSKGMLQRVGLAQAILHDPDLVILDEPMSGLDPVGRRQVRDIILGLKREGKTVLFSSHILSDVESLCDRVGILVAGELRREGTIADLVGAAQAERSLFELEVASLPPPLLARWIETEAARRGGNRVLVRASGKDELERMVRQILDAGASLLAVKPLHGSLEDVFLAETERDKILPFDRSRLKSRSVA